MSGRTTHDQCWSKIIASPARNQMKEFLHLCHYLQLDFHTAMPELPFNLSDYCSPLDTDPHSGNDSGATSMSADGNGSAHTTVESLHM